jgi:hypothetical protein
MPRGLRHVQQCRVIGAFIIFAGDVEAASPKQRPDVLGGNRDAAPPIYFVADAASVDFVLTTKATEADKIAHFFGANGGWMRRRCAASIAM